MKKDRNNNGKNQAAMLIVPAILLTGMMLSGCTAKEDAAQQEVIIDEIDRYTEEESAGGERSDSDGEQITSADLQTDEPGRSEPAESNGQEEESGSQPEESDLPELAEESRSLYEKFLDNDAAATVSSVYPQYDYRSSMIQKENSYTFTELGQRVSEYYLDPEYTDKTSYTYAQYTYVECPDNASDRNLLVKFVGLNIYSPDDDSYAVFVISEDNGQLYITDEYECWARSATLAYGNGILSSSGSGGAGDHYSGISAILSDGTIASVYDTEELYGWWTSYVSDAVYSEVFGADTEPGGLIVSIYTIGDDKYYQYDMSECTEEEKVLCEEYVNRCRDEQSISWAADEEIQAAIKNRCAALGIAYEKVQQKEEAVWSDRTGQTP